MMKPTFIKTFFILFFTGITTLVNAQEKTVKVSEKTETISQKPYKILTNGKRITIQSQQNLHSLLVWTANGHRFVEQKKINANSFSFEVPVKEKIIFMLVEMPDGKRYTSKIGVN